MKPHQITWQAGKGEGGREVHSEYTRNGNNKKTNFTIREVSIISPELCYNLSCFDFDYFLS